MASVTPTFAQQAKTLQEELVRKIITNILTADEFTAQIPAEGIEGYRYIAPQEGTTDAELGPAGWTDPGTAVCIGYATYDQKIEIVRRITADVSMDEMVASHTSKPWTTAALQTASRGKRIGRIWATGVIQGSNSNGQIKGLRNAVSVSQTIDNGTTSGVDLTLDLLDETIDKCEFRPDFLIMPKKMRRAFRKLLRGFDIDSETVQINGLRRDGKIGEVNQLAYDGVPIYVNDFMSAFTYKGGSKYDIICGSFGEQGVTSFYNRRTVLGLEIKPPHMREGFAEDFIRLIWRAGLIVNSPLSVARLTNLSGDAAS